MCVSLVDEIKKYIQNCYTDVWEQVKVLVHCTTRTLMQISTISHQGLEQLKAKQNFIYLHTNLNSK